MTHPQLFCDNHNDKSRNLMLLPALQLSIPIILLFVNIPVEFPWWWRLGCVSVSRAACVAWGWADDEHVVSGKLKILITSHLISIRPHFRSRDRRNAGSSLCQLHPIRGRYQGHGPIRDQVMTTCCARDSLINTESDRCRMILCHHMFGHRAPSSREETSGVLKETITQGIKISSYVPRSAIENTPGLLLAGQIQSLKGSYPCTVGLHPPRGVIILHGQGVATADWRQTRDSATNKKLFWEICGTVETIRDGYKWSGSENQWPEWVSPGINPYHWSYLFICFITWTHDSHHIFHLGEK